MSRLSDKELGEAESREFEERKKEADRREANKRYADNIFQEVLKRYKEANGQAVPWERGKTVELRSNQAKAVLAVLTEEILKLRNKLGMENWD